MDPQEAQDYAMLYQIKVKGRLEKRWSEWLEDLAISYEEGTITLLTGPITDQPRLFGLLIKIRDMGLDLISVQQIGKGDLSVDVKQMKKQKDKRIYDE